MSSPSSSSSSSESAAPSASSRTLASSSSSSSSSAAVTKSPVALSVPCTAEDMLQYALHPDAAWPPPMSKDMDQRVVFAAAELWETTLPVRISEWLAAYAPAIKCPSIEYALLSGVMETIVGYTNFFNWCPGGTLASQTHPSAVCVQPPASVGAAHSLLEKEALVGARLTHIATSHLRKTNK